MTDCGLSVLRVLRRAEGDLPIELEHVCLSVVSRGEGEGELTRPIAVSGWSIAQLLNHLAYNDEIFGGCDVILAGAVRGCRSVGCDFSVAAAVNSDG